MASLSTAHAAVLSGLTLVLASLGPSGCASEANEAEDVSEADIRSGVVANGDAREVGLFLFPLRDGGEGRCTATLIGPRTAITAAHCVLPSSGPGPCTSGSVYLDTTGTGSALATRLKVGVRACATPLVNVGTTSARAQDIAVLALDRKVTELSTFASIASAVPTGKATLFGYGRVGASCTETNPHQKYKVIVALSSNTSPTCKGDSGGPYFVGDGASFTHSVFALVSGETTNGGTRVSADLVGNRAFIEGRRAESEAGRPLSNAR